MALNMKCYFYWLWNINEYIIIIIIIIIIILKKMLHWLMAVKLFFYWLM